MLKFEKLLNKLLTEGNKEKFKREIEELKKAIKIEKGKTNPNKTLIQIYKNKIEKEKENLKSEE